MARDPLPNLYPRDQKAFHMLSVVGKCEIRDFKRYANVDKSRVEKYITKGYIHKEKDPNTGKTTCEFTKEGAKFVREEYGFNPYSAHSWRHDSGLRDRFMAVPDSCKHSIVTETQFKANLNTWIKTEIASGERARVERAQDIDERWKSGELSCPDFTWVNEEGQLVYEEVITDYPQSVIEAKVAMAREFGATFVDTYR